MKLCSSNFDLAVYLLFLRWKQILSLEKLHDPYYLYVWTFGLALWQVKKQRKTQNIQHRRKWVVLHSQGHSWVTGRFHHQQAEICLRSFYLPNSFIGASTEYLKGGLVFCVVQLVRRYFFLLIQITGLHTPPNFPRFKEALLRLVQNQFVAFVIRWQHRIHTLRDSTVKEDGGNTGKIRTMVDFSLHYNPLYPPCVFFVR